PALGPIQTSLLGLGLHPPKDRLHEQPGELREDIAPRGQQSAELEWRAENELSDRYVREDVVHQVRDRLLGAARATARTDRPGLARERQWVLTLASVAEQANEA